MKEQKHGTAESPDNYQPLGKDYPLTGEDITGEVEKHLVEGSNAYENMGASSDVETAGPFGVPDDDLAGEGWVPPTRPGGGWEHPADTPLEERLEQIDNPEEI